MTSKVRAILEELSDDLEQAQTDSMKLGMDTRRSFLSNHRNFAFDKAEQAINNLFSKESRACLKT